MLKSKLKHSLKALLNRFSYLVALPIKLKPQSSLKKMADDTWFAEGDDPYFQVKSRLPWFKGWYFVSLELEHDSNELQMAKLYMDTGLGFSDRESVMLPVKPNRKVFRVFHLTTKAKSIRFDPSEMIGCLRIVNFRLYRIPRFYAVYWMKRRILGLHHAFSQLDRYKLQRVLNEPQQALQLSQEQRLLTWYGETFVRSNCVQGYQDWLEKHERLLAQQAQGVTQLCPLISIILPTYNSSPEDLAACLASVQAQSYPYWQLCVVDDASYHVAHLIILEQAVAEDARVQVYYSETNGHISLASNQALDMVEGEYVLLLDHDDLLHPQALQLFSQAIEAHPQAQLFYADEDKVDEQGHRFQPHLKPDWNPDLLFSQNYIGHPVLLQTQKMRDLGGFRTGYEGSQDHDMLLRYTHGLRADQIIHLPYILYHWRATSNSTAANPSAKSYTEQASIHALQDLFLQTQQMVQVSKGLLPNTYRCQWVLPEHPPLVSLIMPTKDNYEVLKTCVDSILELTDYPNYELLIMDNQTTCIKTLAYLKALDKHHHQVRVIRWDHPFNYSAINNFAVTQAYGDVLCLVNNDLEVIHEDWLTEMVSHALRPEIGCVGAKLYYPNDTIQHAGVILGIGGVAGHAHKYFTQHSDGYFGRLKLIQNYSAVTAACLVLRKSVFNEVAGFDEEHLTVAFNDVDLCLKVREAGYRNLFTPYAELYHHESISRGAEDTPEKLKRAHAEVAFMKQKWQDHLLNDPAYNQNLSFVYENFSLR